MAEPNGTGNPRLLLEVGLAKAAVDSTVRLLAQLSESRRSEPIWQEAKEAARALHLEVAGAEFDSRLPARSVRSGGESIALSTEGKS